MRRPPILTEPRFTTSFGVVDVLRLDSPTSWLACRDLLAPLEAAAQAGPWVSWANWHAIAHERYAEAPHWLMTLARSPSTSPDAAVVLRTEYQAHRLGTLAVLRTLDWAVVRQRPLLVAPELADWSSHALLAALPALHRTTGCALLSLYAQDADATTNLLTEAATRHVPVQVRTTSTCPQLTMPDDLESYFARDPLTHPRHIQRLAHVLQRDCISAPRLWRVRGRSAHHADVHEAWCCFRELWPTSWQWAFQDALGESARNARYLERLVDDLGTTGTLDIALLMIGTRAIAGYVSLVHQQTVWLVVGVYDQAMKKYSPGALAMAWLIEDSARRGDTLLDFGGESQDWKRHWATHEVPLLQVTLPLSPWLTLLCRLVPRWSLSDAHHGQHRGLADALPPPG